MAFTQNHEAASNFGDLKPEGDYEVIITAAEERTTKNDKTGLNFTLVIRNDIAEQKYGNACLFYTAWKAVNPTEQDNAVNGYKFGQIMALGKAAQLPDKKQYKDLNEYLSDLVNKCVRVTMKHNEWNGTVNERIEYLSPTNHPDCKHVFKTKADVSNTLAPQTFTQYANATVQNYIEANESSDDDDDYPF